MFCRIYLSTIIGVLFSSLLFSQTTIPAGYVSGTWTSTGSPYNVQGNITIHGDSTLNIEPGVMVDFQGSYSLTVNGYLEALGTENDSIHFFPANTTNGWNSIRFADAPDSSHLSYCTVSYTGNYVFGTGGISCINSNPVITRCRISNNNGRTVSISYAGGIALNNSNADISWCTISNNYSGQNGGGINVYNSSPVITGCNIAGNETVQHGGGISIYANSSPIITNCTIENNTSNIDGGGIWAAGGETTISECTVGHNVGWDEGGGIWIYSGPVFLDHCIIDHNSCVPYEGQGGGIYAAAGTFTVDHCTFDGNFIQHGIDGTDIYTAGSAAMTITNSAGFAGFIAILFNSTTPASVSYNDLFWPGPGCFGGYSIPPGLAVLTTTNANGDPCDVYNNIFLYPLFVGGDDFHLTEDSPCIDAGDPTSPYDPDGTVADMGCYYFDQSAPGIPCAVTDLTISCDSLSTHLTWSPVTIDTSGNPITVSRYVVYMSLMNPRFIPTPGDSIGSVFPPDTTYMDLNALTLPKRFYNVKVVME
jgi:hypothetical protein